MMKNCKECKHWKNNQAGIGYQSHLGFCLSSKHRYDSNGKDNQVFLFDKDNKHPKHYHTSHNFENIKQCTNEYSRYVLITGQDFGCINFEEGEK
jgi:hypothetical protein